VDWPWCPCRLIIPSIVEKIPARNAPEGRPGWCIMVSMPGPLNATKFHVPASPPDWAPRPQLSAPLDSAMQRPCKLILLPAPTGFGKTTLAAQWLRQREICGMALVGPGRQRSGEILAIRSGGTANRGRPIRAIHRLFTRSAATSAVRKPDRGTGQRPFTRRRTAGIGPGRLPLNRRERHPRRALPSPRHLAVQNSNPAYHASRPP